MPVTSDNYSQSKLRIIFMGTPEFAVPSLEQLMKAGHDIAAVVTAPDKPSGRGLKIREGAVKKFALENGLRILQPVKLKDPSFVEQLRLIHADIQVVVAFRMLPDVVWNMPPMGTINLHASLLPQYRGAAPVNRAIMNGEKETGLTTFRLKHEIDTGDILLYCKLPIRENETAGELHDVMKDEGAKLLVKTIEGIAGGTLKEIPQVITGPLKTAPKIFPEDCRIDWSRSAKEIYNQVRGLSPFPGAFTEFQQKILKIYRCEIEYSHHQMKPGEMITDKKNILKFACTDGFINIIELQAEGKKKMQAEDFIRGYRFE